MSYTFNLNDIHIIAAEILAAYPTQKVFALHGQMGAGKTTLVNAFCKALGVTESTSSPSYAIIAEYKGLINNQVISICHMDWYRLRDSAAAFDAGVMDYLQNPNYYCFIEWPTIAESLLPADALHLTINILKETQRSVTLNLQVHKVSCGLQK